MGDMHGDIDTLAKNITDNQLGKKDIVIITGDAGFVFGDEKPNENTIKRLESLGPTISYVDGNHEGFDALLKYDVIDFYGGKAHQISENVYHVLRGQIINVEGKKIFTFGGASSRDKTKRLEKGLYWSKLELPSEEEMNVGIKNLSKCNWSVDYIVTHQAPKIVLDQLKRPIMPDEVKFVSYLGLIKDNCQFDTWFFGHHHLDEKNIMIRDDNRRYCCLYKDVIKV